MGGDPEEDMEAPSQPPHQEDEDVDAFRSLDNEFSAVDTPVQHCVDEETEPTAPHAEDTAPTAEPSATQATQVKTGESQVKNLIIHYSIDMW